MLNYFLAPDLKSRPKDYFQLDVKKQTIIDIVCGYYNVDFRKLVLPARKRSVVFPRQMIMYMLRINTRLSHKHIGKTFNRDHTTVIHSYDAIRDLCASDEAIRNDRQLIQAMIDN